LVREAKRAEPTSIIFALESPLAQRQGRQISALGHGVGGDPAGQGEETQVVSRLILRGLLKEVAEVQPKELKHQKFTCFVNIERYMLT
jgi:hypothetical protein